MLYPHSIKINKCKGSCNTINNPYAKICVPDKIKNTNVKVFNLISRINETRHIERHKTCKCRLDASVCNNKQDGMKTNADVNVKKLLTKEYVITDLFGILVIASVNVTNHVILENI